MLNYVRDVIFVACKIAEKSRIPVLFLSNPGWGKTTTIETFAELNGYEVEALIGSQRTAEEILGYQVRIDDESRTEKAALVTVPPDWYDRIIINKKNKKKTLLLIDEIQAAPEPVQAAMLQLIFGRKVGGNNLLPEDTLIISAANYKNNLPPQFTLMAPIINRFMLVNLSPTDGPSGAIEFLQKPENRTKDLIPFDDKPITEEIDTLCRTGLQEMFTNLFRTFTEDLDINNQNLDGIFEQEGKIYNFISGRTISYCVELAKAIYSLDLAKDRYGDLIATFLNGLIGGGTNSFIPGKKGKKDEISVDEEYRNMADQLFRQTLISMKNLKTESTKSKKLLNYSSLSIAESVSSWQLYNTGSSVKWDENFTNLVAKIENKFGTDVKSISKILVGVTDNTSQIEFITDINAIKTLNGLTSLCSLKDVTDVSKKLSIIIATYEGYAAQVKTYLGM